MALAIRMAHDLPSEQQTVGPLWVIPPLLVYPTSSGRVVLTRKFVDGMAEYVKRWPSRVGVLAQASSALDDNLDHIEVDLGRSPFGVDTCDFADEGMMLAKLRGAGMVLATLDYRQGHVQRLCRAAGVPVVYVAEQSLRTRRQIIRAEIRNPLRRVVRSWREVRRERIFREAVRHANGVQCNGTPTYEAYRRISVAPLLFFDTRVSSAMIASPSALSSRTAELMAGEALRLGFSGRLVAIKGVDHLPKVAAELKRRGVKFTLDIFGGGGLAGLLEAEVRRLALVDSVRLRGTVDFNRELVPFMTRNIDLFVCCHRQGDPSCTYLETLSCGVPIIGYDNEAFMGLVEHSGLGWVAAMDNPKELAAQIARLDRMRPLLADAAVKALGFASDHTFEATMDRRVGHMLSCAKAPGLGAIL